MRAAGAVQVALSHSVQLEEGLQEQLRDQVLAAVAAAEEHSREGAALIADRLRSNFQLVAHAVLDLDRHLFEACELSQIQCFLVGPTPED